MAEKDRVSRREFVRRAGGAAAGLGAVAGLGRCLVRAGQDGDARRPNVLYIMVDDLGYGDLSCYGADDMETPNIDALCRDGLKFTQFYANCPVCSPTRASMLTGQYPDLAGVPGVIRTNADNSWGFLEPDAATLPELLGEVDYHTAMVGKWHLGLEPPNLPNLRGFDHFHGFLGDMMDDYYTHRRRRNNYMRLNRTEVDPKGHATEIFTEWANDYIRDRADTDQPFFLNLTYNAPHVPLQPPKQWVQLVKRREGDIGDKRARLVAFIEHLDHNIGEVLDTLKNLGLYSDTLIIFSSDNGGDLPAAANNDPTHGGKEHMFDGGIRVPTSVTWPGRIRAGSVTDFPALTMDLVPTLCDLAGVEVPDEVDGISLLPELMTRDMKEPDRYMFWMRKEGGKYQGNTYYAARRGKWKLLQNKASEPYRLFNLEEDPREQNPVGKEHPMYSNLKEALEKHIQEAEKVRWKPPRRLDR